uniref:Uncharacterized protein n=1 Tax=Utricularia reniformis TaxID=192314 RepID=A0A1Y0B3Y0_9LAMI|nr:hypothetical protein AEK19_MT1928 [Utricularia reniformis]ART32093.1 hypothetical protein AEK19_MT1928 [Utricularia reniformis]
MKDQRLRPGELQTEMSLVTLMGERKWESSFTTSIMPKQASGQAVSPVMNNYQSFKKPFFHPSCMIPLDQVSVERNPLVLRPGLKMLDLNSWTNAE